jgi:hypothetical protein
VLTGAALALGALYAMLAEGAVATTARNVFPAAERAQLALLTAPVSGICTVAVAVTYRGDKAVGAAAIADTIALAGIAGALAGVVILVAGLVAGYLAGRMISRAARRSRRRGAPWITGKLAAVANRIVDRGEQSVPR